METMGAITRPGHEVSPNPTRTKTRSDYWKTITSTVERVPVRWIYTISSRKTKQCAPVGVYSCEMHVITATVVKHPTSSDIEPPAPATYPAMGWAIIWYPDRQPSMFVRLVHL